MDTVLNKGDDKSTENEIPVKTGNLASQGDALWNKKWLVLGIAVIISILGLTGAYLYSQNQTKKETVTTTTPPTQTKTTPKTTNLNPNTGNLYGDIKVRLKEVIK